MDPIGVLVQQHRKVNDLFEHFEELALDSLDELTQIAHRLAQQLVVHTELVLEACDEHRIAKVLIADILNGSAQDESFIAKVMVLRDIIDPHIIEDPVRPEEA